jgi:hypothetical protein
MEISFGDPSGIVELPVRTLVGRPSQKVQAPRRAVPAGTQFKSLKDNDKHLFMLTLLRAGGDFNVMRTGGSFG